MRAPTSPKRRAPTTVALRPAGSCARMRLTRRRAGRNRRRSGLRDPSSRPPAVFQALRHVDIAVDEQPDDEDLALALGTHRGHADALGHPFLAEVPPDGFRASTIVAPNLARASSTRRTTSSGPADLAVLVMVVVGAGYRITLTLFLVAVARDVLQQDDVVDGLPRKQVGFVGPRVQFAAPGREGHLELPAFRDIRDRLPWKGTPRRSGSPPPGPPRPAASSSPPRTRMIRRVIGAPWDLNFPPAVLRSGR